MTAARARIVTMPCMGFMRSSQRMAATMRASMARKATASATASRAARFADARSTDMPLLSAACEP